MYFRKSIKYLLLAGLSINFPTHAVAQDILWETLYTAGEKAYSAKNYAEAEKQLRSALKDAETLKTGDPRLLKTLNALAEVLQSAGKNSEAEAMLTRVIDIDKDEDGSKSTKVALDLGRLAMLHQQLNRYQDAEGDYLKAIAILKSSNKTSAPDMVSMQANLAVLYMDMGKYSDSEKILQQALTESESKLGSSSAATVGCLDKLAKLYAIQNRFSEAEPLLKRSLETKEKSLGLGNVALAKELLELGKLYNQHGNATDAESYFKRAVSLRERELGQDNADTAAAVLELASYYIQNGRYAEALPLCDRAVMTTEKSPGKNSPLFADALNKQALALMKTDKYERAESVYLQALEIDKKCFGEKSRQYVQDLNGIGLLYLSQGKYEKAEPFYKKALATMESICGPSHPDLAACLNNLAWFYLNQCKYKEAESLARRGLEIREKALGADHPMVARNLSNLAQILAAQGKWSDAAPLLKRALTIDNASLSADHPELISMSRDLATVDENLQDWKEAEDCYRKLLVSDSKALGLDNPTIAADLDGLANVLVAQNKLEEAKSLIKRSSYIKERLPGGLSKTETVSSPGPDDSSCSSSGPIKDKWAVVVGISNFKDANLNLKYAAKDAIDFYNYLVNDAGFKRDHVKLLIDENANRENIVSDLGDGWLKRLANSDDLVVIYLSTHGSGAKQEANNANFIVPYDATFGNLVFKGIPMQWLTAGLKDLVHCDRILLVLDACHGGAVDPSAKGIQREQASGPTIGSAGKGQIIIASSQADQISWESKNYSNSVFTHRLLESLRKNGNNTKLQEAFKSMKEKVEEEVLRDRAEVQTPVLVTGKWKGEDLLLSAPATDPRPGLGVEAAAK